MINPLDSTNVRTLTHLVTAPRAVSPNEPFVQLLEQHDYPYPGHTTIVVLVVDSEGVGTAFLFGVEYKTQLLRLLDEFQFLKCGYWMDALKRLSYFAYKLNLLSILDLIHTEASYVSLPQAPW